MPGLKSVNTDKQRILFVDDSKTQLILVSALLKEAGYEVYTSENIWVSSLVLSIKPHLILMDIEVNGFNGTDTVKSLKLGRAGKGVVILLYSSKTASELTHLCNACGADGYICKSDGGEHLVEIVNASLDVTKVATTN